MEATQKYIETHKDRFLEELIDLLKIPSVSADPDRMEDVLKASRAVKNYLVEAGVKNTRIFETDGHPIVFGDYEVDPLLPTVLVYGHYDVQPPDPIELWDSPPFEPEIRNTKIHPNGAIFARGACDDKGQLFMHIKAFESMAKAHQIPCNIKFLFEGEEEVGSKSLEQFCRKNKVMLACDVVLISDTAIISNDHPSITTGLRGLSYVEVEVTGANRDLHSGVYGGAVANPINVLAGMIASLQDGDKRITIPGFYDKVVELSAEERELMNRAPYNEQQYMDELQVDALTGEKGYTTLERTSIRPSLDVNGIWGGYTGKGAKTVLPFRAYAKISVRLVPNQDPDEITEIITQHLKSIAPKSVQIKVTPQHGGHPVVTPTDSIEYQAASRAMHQTFGKEPIPLRGGGSIPIVPLFEHVLDAKTVLMGFGLDSDDLHSPNEHYGLFNFYQGIRTIPFFYKYYAEARKES